jgi:hypothetical protein
MQYKKWMFVSLIIAVFIASFTFTPRAQAEAPYDACWGQATKVFAKMGKMGEHASQQEEPRHGLYNLAVDFYEAGIIDEPSMAAFGAFLVSIDPSLTVEACMD